MKYVTKYIAFLILFIFSCKSSNEVVEQPLPEKYPVIESLEFQTQNVCNFVCQNSTQFQSAIDNDQTPFQIERYWNCGEFGRGVSFKYSFSDTSLVQFRYKVFQNGKQKLYQALNRQDRSTNSHSSNELGIVDSLPLTFEIYPFDGKSEFDTLSVEVPALADYQLKQSNYQFNWYLNYDYGIDASTGQIIEGWTKEEGEIINQKLQKSALAVFGVRGPPMSNESFKITKYANGSTAQKRPESFELLLDVDADERITDHEVSHGFACPINKAINEWFNFDATFSGYEEGDAECISRITTQTSPWNGQEYDEMNDKGFTANGYWIISGAGEQFALYGLGATAHYKLYLVDKDYFKKIDYAFANRMMAGETFSKEMMDDLIAEIFEGKLIEGMQARDWINSQRNFDCKIVKGPRIMTSLGIRNMAEETTCEIEVRYLYIFENGNAWRGPNGEQYANNLKQGTLHLYSAKGLNLTQPISINLRSQFSNEQQVGSYNLAITSKPDSLSNFFDLPFYKDGFYTPRYDVFSCPKKTILDLVFEFDGVRDTVTIPTGKFDKDLAFVAYSKNEKAILVNGKELIKSENGIFESMTKDEIVEIEGESGKYYYRNLFPSSQPHLINLDKGKALELNATIPVPNQEMISKESYDSLWKDIYDVLTRHKIN